MNIIKAPAWRPVTERPANPNPPSYPPGDPGKPLDFTLTPREKDIAIAGKLHLELRRRQLNRIGRSR